MDKKSQRQKIIQIRKSIDHHKKKEFNQQITNKTIKLINNIKPKIVAVYLSTSNEVDTKNIITNLIKQNISIVVPKLHPFTTGFLLFQRYNCDTKIIHKLNIKEPELELKNVVPINKIDVFLIPLVSFDDQGNRMGMGKGCFDKTLFDVNDNVYKIGLSFAEQEVEQVQTDYWDVPLDYIITQEKTFIIEEKNK